MRGRFRADEVGVGRGSVAVHDGAMDAILHEWLRVWHAPETLEVALVFSEKERLCAIGVEAVIA